MLFHVANLGSKLTNELLNNEEFEIKYKFPDNTLLVLKLINKENTNNSVKYPVKSIILSYYVYDDAICDLMDGVDAHILIDNVQLKYTESSIAFYLFELAKKCKTVRSFHKLNELFFNNELKFINIDNLVN